jgi:hypothetical protein
MRFIVMVKASEESEAGAMPTAEEADAMGRFNDEMIKAGVMLAGEGLYPSSRGARIVFDGGTRTVVDGPFAETKELVAGYWLIEVSSLEEAVEWMRRCPNPTGADGQIEIRQVFEQDEFDAAMAAQPRDAESRLREELRERDA